jgi:hypothetical protein
MLNEQVHADMLTVHTVKGDKVFTNCEYIIGTDALHVVFARQHCRIKYHHCDLHTGFFSAHSSDAIARLRERQTSWRD